MLQRVWGRRCGLLQVLVLVSSAFAADSLYRLVPPDLYVVFSSDLEVTFHLPGNVSLPNAFVKLEGLVAKNNHWIEITTMGLPLGRKTGSLIAACGIVEFAGRYSLTMYMELNGQILTAVTFSAVWPSIALVLPKTHLALTSSVTLTIISRATCQAKLHREFLTMVLFFQRVDYSSETLALPSDPAQVNAFNFSNVDSSKSERVYPCQLFDLDGSYQAALISSTGTTLATSEVMSVTFSSAYKLNIRVSTIFPCAESVRVFYTRTSCSLVDKVRLYELHRRAPGSPAVPLERKYVMEEFTNLDRMYVDVSCANFNESVIGYCFVYVTTSRSTTVVQQAQICLPSHPNAVLPVDGGWSAWTSWTSCSVTCGSGKHSRFRMCNSPPPENGGFYCQGQAAEMSHCTVHCADTLPKTPLRSPTFDPVCYCGCQQTSDSGEIIASGRCQGLATWIINTQAGRQVVLTFRYFDISFERQWVKVRDGESEKDELLFSTDSDFSPRDVTSSGRAMRVEFMTQSIEKTPAEMPVFPINASLPIHVHGFIASYTTQVIDVVNQPPKLYRRVETTVLESDVTIVGITVCAVVVIVVVVFVVVQRVYWRRMPKYSMAATEESPAHLAHSSSAQSSQPSSPGLQVNVDMDIPLTGGAKRKGSAGQRAISRASSISSTCSAGLKKMRTRGEGADAAAGSSVIDKSLVAVCNGSPKPPTKAYTPIGSPYSANASPEEFVHDANFFRASPIFKQVAPRSPKVHPHRLKASPTNTPSSPLPSPSLTKHDLLRKRHERKVSTPGGGEGEREITGSSGSCSMPKSTATPTAAVATTKAEINLTSPTGVSKIFTSSKLSGASIKEPHQRRQNSVDKSSREEEIAMTDSMHEDMEKHRSEPKRSPATEETSFTKSKTKARRPTSLTETYSLDSIASRPSKSRTPKSPEGTKLTSAIEERQTLLPRPDGQSPKSLREESELLEKESKNSSPSKSSLGSKSNKTLSPSRSIATPELEYDDFVVDDPLSYFDYEETSKLTWHGTEKIGRVSKTGKE